MTSTECQSVNNTINPLALIKQQPSHTLFVLSQSRPQQEGEFQQWYQHLYCKTLLALEPVLAVKLFEQHPVDISGGAFPPLPFHYMSLIELSIDGADEAGDIIKTIAALHQTESAAMEPATWLYYPVSEKAGRSPCIEPSQITVAFANAVPGTERDFREWYCTRHIRHALNVEALVSGQCFELTQFQLPGSLPADYQLIAIYEQEGSAEDIVKSFASLPEGTLDFPMLDFSPGRFAEWVYQPIES